MHHIETERLRMRPFAAGDLDDLVRLHGDAGVMAHMRSGVQTRAQTAAELDTYRQTWRDRGFGIWALLDRSGGAFVGECGLRLRDDDGSIGLRFCLRKEWWGRGLAFEAVMAALGHGFGPAGIERVVAVSRQVNPASWRVLEKAGMQCERSYENHVGVTVNFYAISRAEWNSAKGA